VTARFQAPKGAFDLLPQDAAIALAVREAVIAAARSAGYEYIETPIFEDTELFARGVGESTDVVTKEMYTFPDRGGRSMTLRPEGTAPVVRAMLEHGLDRGQLPVKLYYSGPFFRYERPQAGRYRHFWQVGAEAIGTEDPAVDAELIVLAMDAYAGLGLRQVRLLLNSLGCRECRSSYRAALQDYLRGLDLDPETKERVEANPLRVLDDKRPEIQALLADAPLVTDHLCAACKAFHEEVRRLLADAGVGYVDQPRLVRGLDYYTRTLFEFVHEAIGAQSAIGGGGRYDGLSELIGGPNLPGVGWALGVDRTLLAMQAEGIAAPARGRIKAFVVPLGEEARRVAFLLAVRLRRAGLSVDVAYGGRGLKGAMRAADRSGAAYAVIIGERDLAASAVQVKKLATGEQEQVALDDVIGYLAGQVSAHQPAE
jgi:histidyl-tRNA synthetase